ncbi:MAG: GNAT family protein [Bacteroidota bacterium]
MQFEELITPRLRLLKLTPQGYDYIYANFDDVQLIDFLGLTSAEDLAKEKNKHAGGFTTHSISIMAFLLIEKSTGKVIGKCGFHNWNALHSRAELGYHISIDSFKQQGFMTEALSAVLDYGFNHMQLNRIEALIAPQNTPSLKLLERNGFIKEGQLRSHYYIDGVFEDSVVYSLLKHEYIKISL